MKKILRKSLKVLAWIVGSLLGLFLLIVLLIQIPVIQNVIKNKAVTFIQGKIDTKVSIGKLEIGLPKKIVLEDFYFEDQQKDTLVAGKKLAVDISLFKLLSNTVKVNSIELNGTVANISRNRDSVFNYDYILKAFASPVPVDTTKAPMNISVEDIDLNNLRISFKDAITKNDLRVNLKHFDTEITKFNLDSMDFTIPSINLDGFYVNLNQDKLDKVAKEVNTNIQKKQDQGIPFNINLDKINLADIKLNFESAQVNMNSNLDLKELHLKMNSLNLAKQTANIQFIDINGLGGSLLMQKTQQQQVAAPDSTAAAPTAMNWRVKLNRANFDNIAFQYHDKNSKPIENGLDYSNLNLNKIHLDADNFYYSNDTISGKINSFKMAEENSGFKVDTLKTSFLYSSTKSYLKNLYLKTPHTLLRDKMVLQYPSLNALQKNPEKVEVEASLQNSKLAFQDILKLAPQLRNTNPFKSNPNAILMLDGSVSGVLSNLTIPGFQVSGIGNTELALNGSIKGLPDVNTANFNLNISKFHSTARDLKSFAPPGTIPSNIQLPQHLSLTGNFNGTIQNFKTKLNLNSSLGNAKINADVDMHRKNAETYKADVTLDKFNLGKLIQNDSIGTLSLNAQVEGNGLDPKTANATANGKVVQAVYNGYEYKNLTFKGTLKNGIFDAQTGISDPNLDFEITASGDFSGDYPSLQLQAHINKASLDSLHLRTTPLQIQGNISADLTTADPDYLNGKINLTDFEISNRSQHYLLDTVAIISKASKDSTSIRLKSQLLDAELKGKFELTKLGTALSNTIGHYYSSPPSSKPVDTLSPQRLKYTITIKNDPILKQLVPNVDLKQSISLSGNFNSKNDSLSLIGDIPAVKYSGYKITNTHLDIHPEGQALTYNINIDDVSSSQLKIPNTTLSGKLQDNEISYDLLIQDIANKPKYQVAGIMKATENNVQFSLLPKKLLLNYKSWNIPADNGIYVADKGVYVKDFVLNSGSNTISINSPEDSPTSPVNINFDNFEVETLSAMISKDTLLAGGLINGEIIINDLTSKVKFSSNLQIENFNFKRDTIGNLDLKVNNRSDDELAVNLKISGQDNQVSLDGSYGISTSQLNMNLDMQKLHVKSVQGFSFGSISESKGYLSGNLKINGTTSNPTILGSIDFNEVGFRVNTLNSYFQSINDKIAFDNEGIRFKEFTVYDSDKNKLTVNGQVLTTNYTSYSFDLAVDASNFKAMNSTAKDNDLYYGDLLLDTHLKIKGTPTSPVVNGNIGINEGTALTIVLPQSDPSIEDRQGVVEFIDEKSQRDAQMKKMEQEVNTSTLEGMDISVNIKVNKEAELTMIIDQGNGDYIDLKGEGQLNAGIDPSGKTSITGSYQIVEGAYKMSFNFIKREFQIEKGSSITFLGAPTDARVDLTAIYQSKTSPLDLLEDQLGDISAAQRNTYKQQLPFETLLKMNGQLLSPEISFDIRLPEGNYSVSSDIVNNSRAKLAQIRQEPSELNKQVFALLLLNRFIGENPFSSAAGGVSTGTLARQSVSKILSQQLNNLAGDLINGVQLNFDLQSTDDYTTGQRASRTDLNVGVSKNLLNDRLKVTIGSSFGLEGPSGTNRQATNIAGDVSLDYQLSKDGRYVLRVYRINQYEVALQGQVIETGVAFIITMDYNKFMEIFRKNKNK